MQQNSKRPNIGAPIHRFPLSLFWRHVGCSADNHSSICGAEAVYERWGIRKRSVVRGAFHCFRQTEIEHLHLAVRRDLHIGWFQIAMNNPLFVRSSETFAD